MEEKHIPEIAHHDHADNGSNSANSQEKGVGPNDTYPLRDEDYVVTFKTWVVVTILASAYGVGKP
jgi:hypothetical protein